MPVAQTDQQLALIEDGAVDHGVQPLLHLLSGNPLVVAPYHTARLRVDAEHVHLSAADHLAMTVPLNDARRGVGSLVTEALGLPDDIARQLVEGSHTDVLAAGGDDDLVAVNQRMLADALIVGCEAVFVPVVHLPENLPVSATKADQFAHVADHVEAVVIDDGC